jgi:hypothetical protein
MTDFDGVLQPKVPFGIAAAAVTGSAIRTDGGDVTIATHVGNGEGYDIVLTVVPAGTPLPPPIAAMPMPTTGRVRENEGN